MASDEDARNMKETDAFSFEEATAAYNSVPPFSVEEFNDESIQEEETREIRTSEPPGKEAAQNEACLVVIYGPMLGRKYDLATDTVTLGRGESCEIPLAQLEVSRRHCQVKWEDGAYWLHDLESRNGTYVNDNKVQHKALRTGNLVRIGGTILKFLSSGKLETSYHEEIYKLTTVDGLTGVCNRRFMLVTLNRELSRAIRYKRPLSVLMLDIDHFKQVNDEHGHLAGDFVLRHLAAAIYNHVRREDTVARYGGEEFVIVLPEVSHDGAMACAEKVRQLVEQINFSYGETHIEVRVSIGVSTSGSEVTTAKELIGAADANLYAAKASGRNQVCGSTLTEASLPRAEE